MSGAFGQPPPWWRLAIYLIIFGVCGAIALYEAYSALTGEITTGTVLSAGKMPGSSGAQRATRPSTNISTRSRPAMSAERRACHR